MPQKKRDNSVRVLNTTAVTRNQRKATKATKFAKDVAGRSASHPLGTSKAARKTALHFTNKTLAANEVVKKKLGTGKKK